MVLVHLTSAILFPKMTVKKCEVLMCKCDSHWVDLSFILLLQISILAFESMEIMMAQQKKKEL